MFRAMWDSEESRWARAQAWYETNKSFREIEAELGLSRSSLHRRALAEGWVKGRLMPLVNEGVRIELALRALTPVARKAVEDAVNRQLKMIKLDQAGGNPWLKRLVW